MAGWIYAYRDSGYEHGIKIGRDASANLSASMTRVPCYAPRPYVLEAAWKIEGEKKLHDVERELKPFLGTEFRSRPGFERAGREWFELDATEARERVSSFLGRAPDRGPAAVPNVDYDDFRNPPPHKVPQHRFKLALWLWQEAQTGRLKCLFIDDWTGPREKARRYSRNGIAEVAAWTYQGAVSADANLRLLSSWQRLMRELAGADDWRLHGWLAPTATAQAVAESAVAAGLIPLGIRQPTPPEGIRHSYNRAE